MKRIMLAASCLVLAACSKEEAAPAAAPAETAAEVESAVTAAPDLEPASNEDRLASVLAQQPAEAQARYEYRHPQETLEFFGIEPGMTVVEALPGGGWYSKILIPYLGADGTFVAADYAMTMWPRFEGMATEEFLAKRASWATDFVAQASEWRGANGAAVKAFVFESMPEDMAGAADAVLFIRALHNLARFEEAGGHLSAALADAHKVLKPGGLVGVVQHRAPDENSDAWANGSNGYLKTDFVISAFEKAGFELVSASEINANPNDQPTEQDIVWRLPPTYGTSGDNADMRAEMDAIGESDRMTLLFRKPV